MKAKYFAPDGNDISDVSASQIFDLMRLNDDYWESGSGDAAIRFSSKDAGELTFMVRESLGVFLQYTDPNDDSDWVLSRSDDSNEVVSVTQGGAPWELPREYFVDQKLAEQVIEEFVRTARRPTVGNWVPF